jgi:hypothetical protein
LRSGPLALRHRPPSGLGLPNVALCGFHLPCRCHAHLPGQDDGPRKGFPGRTSTRRVPTGIARRTGRDGREGRECLRTAPSR